MATTSNRTTTLMFTGDMTATQAVVDAANAVSPGVEQLVTLASGANTITAPTGGSTPVALTIIPPATNVQTLVLKGVTGDTGVGLHPTASSTISLVAGFTTLVLTAGGTVTGMRLIWS